MDISYHAHSVHHHKHWHFFAAYMSIFVFLAIIGYYITMKPAHILDHDTSASKMFTTDLTYYDLPRISIVVGANGRESHLRIDMSLEVDKKNLSVVEGYQPRITAKLNRFLLTVDPERIQDEKWLPWLRTEMLSQINSVGDPAPVHDLMFRQLVVM